MSDDPPRNENLADEFQALGKNLVEAMRTAWESPERKQLQQELENGLHGLEATLKREAETFSNSPTAQQLKEDANRIGEKINTGEISDLIRQELLKALQTANNELQNIINRWTPGEPDTISPDEHSPQEGPK